MAELELLFTFIFAIFTYTMASQSSLLVKTSLSPYLQRRYRTDKISQKDDDEEEEEKTKKHAKSTSVVCTLCSRYPVICRRG